MAHDPRCAFVFVSAVPLGIKLIQALTLLLGLEWMRTREDHEERPETQEKISITLQLCPTTLHQCTTWHKINHITCRKCVQPQSRSGAAFHCLLLLSLCSSNWSNSQFDSSILHKWSDSLSEDEVPFLDLSVKNLHTVGIVTANGWEKWVLK